jgi:hypothetical protein
MVGPGAASRAVRSVGSLWLKGKQLRPLGGAAGGLLWFGSRCGLLGGSGAGFPRVGVRCWVYGGVRRGLAGGGPMLGLRRREAGVLRVGKRGALVVTLRL